MTRKEIVLRVVDYREKLLYCARRESEYCMTDVLPFGEDYVYKNALGTKFFLVKRCVTGVWYVKMVKAGDEPALTLKEITTFEEIYFVNYDSDSDTLTYVYAKDVDSGSYDTPNGLAIDLTKIPKKVISGKLGGFIYEDNIEILTLEELFVLKDLYFI